MSGGLDVKAAIARVTGGGDLSADEIAGVFGQIMDGAATPAQIGGLLVALRMKGETADEIAGAASAMRARATPLAVPDPARAVDTCGTGGDGSGTVNVSTLAAVIAAAAGAQVAKHGNRALTSKAGSADVLEHLGVVIDAAPAVVEACIATAGIGFAFAPAFHAATRVVGGPRRELGTRTIFNLLGPLTNPAKVAHQVVGVYDRRWCGPVARALGLLGARRVFVVHGAGGLDEIAVRGATWVAAWDDGGAREYELMPADFGLADADPAELAGGDAAFNAAVLRTVLAGDDARDPAAPTRAVRQAAVMTAGLALVAVGIAGTPAEGAATAAAAIDDGRAAATLERWIAASRGTA
ncbi:MAG TPA: anthranilate phosphoribosyltransferase [Kofleriaceae bacterium]|nr:anthranilate phosphoribosyltransferase [Kofleriaceae bacterium]